MCCVRKRPLLAKELDLKDYDVFTGSSELSDITIVNDVDPSTSPPKDVTYTTSSIWAHKGEFKLDNKVMYLQHHGYRFHDVFVETDDSSVVYQRAIAHLVREQSSPTADGRNLASVIFYGQSGSGKTYTQEAIVELSLRDMFADNRPDCEWSLSCYEIYADKVADLLQERAPVQLRQDAAGLIHAVGGSEHKLPSVEAATALLAQASALRATEVSLRSSVFLSGI